MTKQPPLELIQQWANEKVYDELDWLYEIHIANCAAQWGANEELEACCEWLDKEIGPVDSCDLRGDRRPKHPTLKEQALKALKVLPTPAGEVVLDITDVNTIRRALLSNITDDFNKIPQN